MARELMQLGSPIVEGSDGILEAQRLFTFATADWYNHSGHLEFWEGENLPLLGLRG